MTIDEILEKIKEDKLLEAMVTDLKGKKIHFRILQENKQFTAVGLQLKQAREFDEAERIFKTMLDRGETSSATRNNYGAVLLDDIFSKLREDGSVDPGRIDEARMQIFEACNFDKKVSLGWPAAPAYKNLCFLRNVEAYFRYSKGDFLGAFVLGWISIEMTLHRIWFQYLQKNSSSILNEQVLCKKLMSWSVQDISEVLFKTQIIDSKVRKSLSDLRTIRNKLVHGEINDPTKKNAEECVIVGYNLIPILQ